MDLMDSFKTRARNNKKKLVLPEGNEPRVIKAAAQILEEDLADLYLLGKREEIETLAKEAGVSVAGAELVDPAESELLAEFTDLFFELRKHKGITREKAAEIVVDPLYFGTMLVHTDRAAGMVAGAINATGNVLRPAFQIVKTKPGLSVVSGAFIMQVKDSRFGKDGLLIFADCAVNPAPDANQLAEIAISSAETARELLEIDPVVALLSFSTRGSASHKLVDKVQEAVKIAREKAPELVLDGELQADAALVPTVAQTKCPESKVGGKANVLVFPDLQAGNIGYKLVQRLGDALAIGPVLQGIAKPINDLSRGSSVEDIVNVVAITSVQAGNSQGK